MGLLEEALRRDDDHQAMDSLTHREARRRRGYTKNLAHQIAHFVAGWEIGWDLHRLPRQGTGTFSLDLMAGSSTLNGNPAAFRMLPWCRDLLHREVDRLNLPRDWVISAGVDVAYTWEGEHYRLVSIGRVLTRDSSAEATVENIQLPLPERPA